MFQKLCGDDGMKNVVLCTTMWDLLQPEVAEKRENELKGDFWAPMLKMGATVMRHDGKAMSAKAVVRKFFDGGTIDTLLQNEIVHQRKKLIQTSAGSEVDREIRRLQEKYTRELEDLKSEMARRKGNAMQEALEKEKKTYEEYLAKLRRVRGIWRGIGRKTWRRCVKL